MARPRTVYRLFDHQFDALDGSVEETLLEGRGGGASHTLRIGAISLAAQYAGARVLLIQKNEGDLRRDHLEGPKGLLAMLSDAQRAEAVRVTDGEARWAHASSIRWTGVARDGETSRILDGGRVDVLLIDNAEEIPEAVFLRLRDAVRTSIGPVRRIIVASRNPAGSWVERHFSTPDQERRRIDFSASPLPENLRAIVEHRSFRSMIEAVRPGFKWYRHVEVVADSMQRLFDRTIANLAVFVPPQHGKSELGPRLGAAYRLERYPQDWIAITCYGSDEANKRNFNARDFYRRGGGEVQQGAGAVNYWGNIYGGGIWSAGITEGQTGRPMSFGIVDDPDKDIADAISAHRQERKRAWYTQKWRGRESMFGATKLSQLLIATRWDAADTAGYILREAARTGEPWHIVCLPALYTEDAVRQFTDPATIADSWKLDGGTRAEIDTVVEGMLKSFTVEPDWRTEPGEPICPEVRERDEWARHRSLVGPLVFSAEWQQAPLPVAGGGIFKREWFEVREPEDWPAKTEIVARARAWDDGATAGGGDATASILMWKLKTGELAIAGATEHKIDGSEVKPLKITIARADGRDVIVSTPQDPGAAGKTDFGATERALKSDGKVRTIHNARPSQNKRLRARDLSSIARPAEDQEFGRVMILRGPDGMVGDGNVSVARLLAVFHKFRGLDGDDDNLIDAAVDAKTALEESRPKTLSIH